MVSPMTQRDALVALDRAHVWRPFASTEDHESKDPLVCTHAEGIRLTDADGRTFLDATGSWWCTHLGHANPRLLAALRRQSAELPHCAMAGIAHAPAVELAAKLVEHAPKAEGDARLERVFFVDNGSTAVEVALKLAFQYWHQNGRPERRRFLALPGGYHGDTIGAMSVGALDEVGAVFAPLLFATNDAKPIVDPAGWAPVFDALIAQLQREGDAIAGVVVEPIVQGASGMRMYPAEQLARLREACDRADTFLIADEVFTGLGRTGPMWGCDHAGIAPDLLAVAKGLSGGLLPFGATLASKRIHEGFRGDTRRAFLHGHTFCGNPLGAAVALEVLRIYEEEHILAEAEPKARRLAAAFERMGELPGARFARSLGMVGAVDVGAGGYHGRVGWAVQEAARERGVWLRPLGDVIYAVPPLNVADDDLDELLAGMEAALAAVLSA